MLKFLVSAVLVAALASLGAFKAMTWFDTTDVVVGDDPVEVVVPPGANASSVLDGLIAAGHVEADMFWKPWLIWRSPGACLQAGTHTVPATATPAQLYATLCGTTFATSASATLPEGWTQWEVADRLSDLGIVDHASFLDAAAVYHACPVGGCEGLMFPDTYFFDADTPPDEVLSRIVSRHHAVWQELAATHTDAFAAVQATYGVDDYETLIMASLVEAEAVVDSERPLIARAFYNRIALGMRLQTDPTCVYGPQTYAEVPTRSTCRDPLSVYSTYIIDGLPPTPIGNPGRASIAAAMNPASDADVLYFVAMQDGTGRHAFAATLPEHNANVDRYLR